MSLEQAQAFAQGLQDILTQFKADQKAMTDEFAQYVSTAGKEFQTKAHTFAKDSVSGVDELATDIQALYKETYGEELPPPIEGGGGETPPPVDTEANDPSYGIDKDAGWSGEGDRPSTGPVGPQPKKK